MLLSIDAGNTGIKFGIFSVEDCSAPLETFSLSTSIARTADEYRLVISQFTASYIEHLDDCVISSVVPSVTAALKDAASMICRNRPFIIERGTKTGFFIKTDINSQLGADIVCNTAAALDMADGPIIIVDMGTAITVTAVSRARELLGTVIIPGMDISASAMSEHAALLNDVTLKRPSSIIGKNTQDSIQSGVVNGYIYMIDGFVRNMKEQLCHNGEAVSLIGCGGQSNILKYCENSFTILPYLTLCGAAVLWKINRK